MEIQRKWYELVVGGTRHGFPELFQLLLGFTMTAPQTLIEKLHSNVGVMQQCLVEEGHQDRIAPRRHHTLQRLIGGLPANLRQPFRPVQDLGMVRFDPRGRVQRSVRLRRGCSVQMLKTRAA